MNWFLFFGAILIGWSLYFFFFLYATTKKPEMVAGMALIEVLEKALGKKGMVRFFAVTGGAMFGLGLMLILMSIG
jgi:hypothetical protein